MKRCPRCNRVETDEALKFCRVDGVTLVSDSGSVSGEKATAKSVSAAMSSEIETSVLPHRTDSSVRHPTAPTTVLPAAATPSTTSELTKSKRHGVVFGLIALVILGVVIGGYFYFSRKTTAAIQSIAVMPFVNQNDDPNADYLTEGIPENIINSLSQLPNLKVMSRNSTFRYKGKDLDAQAVAKELNVQSVLTGRVMQRGDSLSIGVELINARDNSQIWGQQYNRKLADVFAVQEEIAQEISAKLRLKLSSTQERPLAKPRTENLTAFQFYMQGRAYTQRRTREDLFNAVSFFQRAVAEDQNYALAYAGLAEAFANLGLRGYMAPIEGRRKSEEAARRALALDANLAEAHVAFGQSCIQFAPYQFASGDSELRRAIELSPSLATAHEYLGFSLLRQGRVDEGLAEALKAREYDPLSSIIAREVAFAYLLKRDYSKALELLRHANELGPAMSTQWEIGMYIQNREYSEALTELAKAKIDRKNDPILIYSTGMVYAAQGKRVEALQSVKELESMSSPNLDQAHWIAKIYVALNEKELGLSWLEKGFSAGAIGGFYANEPVWDPIRSDPRFADLIQRMGVPQLK